MLVIATVVAWVAAFRTRRQRYPVAPWFFLCAIFGTLVTFYVLGGHPHGLSGGGGS
jgi:hypothetical protein